MGHILYDVYEECSKCEELLAENKKLRNLLLELGEGDHNNKNLYEWYCKNKK